MTDFGALVRSGTVPDIEGFYRWDGTVRRVEYDGPQLSWFKLGLAFVPHWESDPDGLVEVDWADRAVLPSVSGSVCCGEGPMGADGFFARLDADGVPIWVIFMAHSNPFVHVHVEGMMAKFTNNLDRSVVINLELPDFAA